MDESTSALDVRNERLLYQALKAEGARVLFCSQQRASICVCVLAFMMGR